MSRQLFDLRVSLSRAWREQQTSDWDPEKEAESQPVGDAMDGSEDEILSSGDTPIAGGSHLGPGKICFPGEEQELLPFKEQSWAPLKYGTIGSLYIK